MKKDPDALLPLAPAAFHILLALAADELHGYAIMQEVSRQSGSRYKLGPGTLYDNLQRLMEEGVVAEGARPGKDDDPRRRYYKLTAFGRRVLAVEVTRLEALVRQARLHLEAS